MVKEDVMYAPLDTKRLIIDSRGSYVAHLLNYIGSIIYRDVMSKTETNSQKSKFREKMNMFKDELK